LTSSIETGYLERKKAHVDRNKNSVSPIFPRHLRNKFPYMLRKSELTTYWWSVDGSVAALPAVAELVVAVWQVAVLLG
jgi:hypothetical protein